MAIEGHTCEHECEDWVVGDGQSAVEDFLNSVHDHNRALLLRDMGVPLPRDHCTGLRPVSELTLLHALPLDVVSKVIWPILMDKECHLENYRTCLSLRAVSTGWREYVERQKEWTLGVVANARHRVRPPVEASYNSEFSSDSDSDSTDGEEEAWSLEYGGLY